MIGRLRYGRMVLRSLIGGQVMYSLTRLRAHLLHFVAGHQSALDSGNRTVLLAAVPAAAAWPSGREPGRR